MACDGSCDVEWANEHLPRQEAVAIITPDASATETLQAIAQALDAAGFSIDEQKAVRLGSWGLGV